MIYKENLAKEFGTHDNGTFQADVVELRRRMKEENYGTPGFSFQFDFPDFPSVVERIVSRNVEAWGYELLASFQEAQKNDDSDASVADNPLSHLKNLLDGNYQITRRDDRVISIRYTIDYYYSGAAHGGRSTRVLNYLLQPFNPITLEYLLGDITRLPRLADHIRQKLADTGRYKTDWLIKGTDPTWENFSLFNIDQHGLTFTFPEYRIACYAEGEQRIWVSFYEIAPFCDPKAIASMEVGTL